MFLFGGIMFPRFFYVSQRFVLLSKHLSHLLRFSLTLFIRENLLLTLQWVSRLSQTFSMGILNSHLLLIFVAEFLGFYAISWFCKVRLGTHSFHFAFSSEVLNAQVYSFSQVCRFRPTFCTYLLAIYQCSLCHCREHT